MTCRGGSAYKNGCPCYYCRERRRVKKARERAELRRLERETSERSENTGRVVSASEAWRDSAGCKSAVDRGEAERADWFPEGGGRNGRVNLTTAHRAIAICEACPVSEQCLAEARKHGWVGIWGGELLTLKEKQVA